MHAQTSGNGGVHMKSLMSDPPPKGYTKAMQVTYIIETMSHAQQNEPLIRGECREERIQILRILIDMQSPQMMHLLCEPTFARSQR